MTMSTETVQRLTVLEDGSEAMARVDALNAQARAVMQPDPERGMALVEQAERLAQDWGYDRGQAECVQIRGWRAFDAGDYAEALRVSEAALSLCRACDDGALEAGALRVCGQSHEALGRPDRALECHYMALHTHRKSGDSVGESALLNAIGMVFIALGDHDAATENFAAALALARRSGQRLPQLSPLGNMGNIYAEIGDYGGALRCHREVLGICREQGHRAGEVMALCGIALSLHNLGDSAQSSTHIAEALTLARTLGYSYLEAHALHAQAEIADDAGEKDQALALYRHALASAREAQNRGLEITLLCGMGRISVRQGDATAACSALTRALELAEASGQKTSSAQAHEALAEVCEQCGDIAAALTHYKAFHTLDKETVNAQAADRMRARLVLMETEKAQQEAELHRVRSVDLARANAALELANQSLRSQAERLQEQAAELERMAAEDALTGLYNRRYLEAWLEQQFDTTQRQPMTAVLMDLDRFKDVNDRFGHQIGDSVLRTFAAILRRTCRASDMIARWGGEEFVVVLPETSEDAARVVCEKLRLAVEAYPWQEIAPGLQVTVSLGLCGDPLLPNYERLLSAADAFLYAAKSGGRNRVCWDRNGN